MKHDIDLKQCKKCKQCYIDNYGLIHCKYAGNIAITDIHDYPCNGKLEYIANNFADKLQEKIEDTVQCLPFEDEYIIKIKLKMWGITTQDINIHITDFNKSGYVKHLETVVTETVSLVNKVKEERLRKALEELNEEIEDNKITNGKR